MHKMRNKHWSCTKFAHWAFNKMGCPKPNSATMDEWDNWQEEIEEKHPIAYKLIDNGLDLCQDIIMFPTDVIHAVRYYYRSRFVLKSHYLQTKLEPGKYHENDVRILHGLFETLVDFVEVEKANMLYWTSLDDDPRPWWHRISLLRWGEYRSREDGIAYLNWEMELLDWDNRHFSQQAMVAQEIYDLYIWWKDIRPNRPDPYEVSGWSDWMDERGHLSPRKIFGEDPDPDKTMKLLAKLHKIENEYDQEDERNLIRLIKIRSHLWT